MSGEERSSGSLNVESEIVNLDLNMNFKSVSRSDTRPCEPTNRHLAELQAIWRLSVDRTSLSFSKWTLGSNVRFYQQGSDVEFLNF
jgi:hypothetical protein